MSEADKFNTKMAEVALQLLELRCVVQIILPSGFGKTRIAQTLTGLSEQKEGTVMFLEDFMPARIEDPENTILIWTEPPEHLQIPEGVRAVVIANKPIDVGVPAFIITVNDYKSWTYW